MKTLKVDFTDGGSALTVSDDKHTWEFASIGLVVRSNTETASRTSYYPYANIFEVTEVEDAPV